MSNTQLHQFYGVLPLVSAQGKTIFLSYLKTNETFFPRKKQAQMFLKLKAINHRKEEL